MKKILVAAAVIVAMMGVSSCKTVYQTATTQDVASTLSSDTRADLVVSPTKITYYFKPSKQVRRNTNKNIVATAVAEALKANGNADVLVNAQYKITTKRGGIREVVVTGYPATYKNFTVVK